uniref:Uncharacterized protein n=1 Tax=Anguilla anguilla TaxID=7936 RepID=A0A0E9XCY2_ANGAN
MRNRTLLPIAELSQLFHAFLLNFSMMHCLASIYC